MQNNDASFGEVVRNGWKVPLIISLTAIPVAILLMIILGIPIIATFSLIAILGALIQLIGGIETIVSGHRLMGVAYSLVRAGIWFAIILMIGVACFFITAIILGTLQTGDPTAILELTSRPDLDFT